MTEEIATEIVPVHPTKVSMVWPTVLPWLEKAMEHGDGLYAADDILEAIMGQVFILFVAVREERVIGMAIASIDPYPRKTVASVRWSGGDAHTGRDWLSEMIAELKRWGKHFGAVELVGAGRKGWLRGPYGFKEAGVLFKQGIDE